MWKKAEEKKKGKKGGVVSMKKVDTEVRPKSSTHTTHTTQHTNVPGQSVESLDVELSVLV